MPMYFFFICGSQRTNEATKENMHNAIIKVSKI